MITVNRKLKIQRGPRGQRRVAVNAAVVEQVAPGRVPRISRLMALAIRFEQMLRDGTVSDQSAVARLVHVTQPRMTQIMNLLHLAPDIQEELLLLPRMTAGRDSITERDLRPVAAEVDWRKQRERWSEVNCRVALGAR